jgi:hypothetical protein
MPSLSLKASINYPFIGGGSVGPSYDPDALAWFTAVEATGNTITLANKTAFNTAFLALKSNNIWSRITQGCFFVGIDGANPLTGAFTPFKTPTGITPTNVNFTTSDYNRLTGIVQDSTGGGDQGTKTIDTGVQNHLTTSTENPALPRNDRHILLYNSRNDLNTDQTVGSFFASVGGTGTRRCRAELSSPDSFGEWRLQNNSTFTVTRTQSLAIYNGGKGFMGMCWNSADNAKFYAFENQEMLINGFPVTVPTPTTTGIQTGNMFISNTSSTGLKRIAFYSLGNALLDNEDAGLGMLSTYGTIIDTLLSSLV